MSAPAGDEAPPELPSSAGGRAPRHAEVRRIVAEHLPARPAATVTRLGEGTDHAAFLVDGEVVVRLALGGSEAERRAGVARERELLRVAASLSPVPVPSVLFADPARGCLAYRRLAGEPLLAAPPAWRAEHARAVARTLGAVLAALHGAPTDAPTGAPTDALRARAGTDVRPADAWRAEAAEHLAAVAWALPEARRRAVARFVDTPPDGAPFLSVAPAFTHNDLGIEHVLVDAATGRVTGIIDWSDAAVADPAVDFARLLRDLGPAALDAALAVYGGASPGDRDALRARVEFLARCLLLEDLAFGLETGAAPYVAKSLEALAWLFPE